MAARKRSKRKEQAPGWVWMLFGLSIGLTVALVIYLQTGAPAGSPTPLASRAPAAAPERTAPSPPPEEPAASAAAVPPDADETEQETELGFYKRLRELEVAIPDARPGEAAPTQLAHEYTIQAGSFRTYDEADSRRATLALLAIDSQIVRAIVGNDIFHRVIIGPLSDLDEIERIKRRLDAENIDTLPPRLVPEA